MEQASADLATNRRIAQIEDPGVCGAEGCERSRKTKQRQSVYSRLVSDLDKSSGCWISPYKTNSKGYVSISNRRNDNSKILGHRAMYEFMRGNIPPHLVIDHLCRNRACLNPWHMEIVTNRENNLRGTSIAARNHKKKKCNRGHLLGGSNLIISISKGFRRRICGECKRAKNRAWYWRRKGVH